MKELYLACVNQLGISPYTLIFLLAMAASAVLLLIAAENGKKRREQYRSKMLNAFGGSDGEVSGWNT